MILLIILNKVSFIVNFLFFMVIFFEEVVYMLYRINNGSVILGGNTILEAIYFEIHDNEKVGIVGRNGSGKSTLLKAIVEDLEIEQVIRDENLRINKIGVFSIGYKEKN